MAPTPIRLHNFKPGELPTSFLTREAETMQIQSTLQSRSDSSSGAGGVGEDTIIFIVLGVGWSHSFFVLCNLVRRCAPHDTVYVPEVALHTVRSRDERETPTFHCDPYVGCVLYEQS